MKKKKKLESLGKNSIQLEECFSEDRRDLGASRFGGNPDVPPDFVWPTYEGEDHKNVVKERPLSFLAQFACADLAPFDKEHLLPDHGLLSFFYESNSQPWGYDPKDKGCARVYWFEDLSVLSTADFPADMEDDFSLPMGIKMESTCSYPSWEDFSKVFPDEDGDAFDAAWEKLVGEDSEVNSRLLGWPDLIQHSMFAECDMVAQGYNLGNGGGEVPKEVRQRAEESAHDRWTLLLQMEYGVWATYGFLYFYITKEDLAARRFDRIWLIFQCD